MWNGAMFVDLDLPLNASSLLSASAELLVADYEILNKYTSLMLSFCWNYRRVMSETSYETMKVIFLCY